MEILKHFVYLLIINIQIILAFQLQEEFQYCKDITRVDFSKSCTQNGEDCNNKKTYLLTFINHQDFFFKYGKLITLNLQLLIFNIKNIIFIKL